VFKAWKAHGLEGLNRKPGPKPGPRKLKPVQAEEKRSALAQASARIVELERLVGRQQLDIDFFRKALRALERPAAQGNPANVAPKEMPRSRIRAIRNRDGTGSAAAIIYHIGTEIS
jgi:transposase